MAAQMALAAEEGTPLEQLRHTNKEVRIPCQCLRHEDPARHFSKSVGAEGKEENQKEQDRELLSILMPRASGSGPALCARRDTHPQHHLDGRR